MKICLLGKKIFRSEISKTLFIFLFVVFLFPVSFPVMAKASSEKSVMAARQNAVGTTIDVGSTIISNSVVDGTGRTVVVAGNVKRIVSLGPAATEILFAIGASSSIVARTDYCDFPKKDDSLFFKEKGEPGVESVPSLGGFDGKSISLETIIAAEPDLVIAYSVLHDHLLQSFEQYNIPVFVSNASSIDDVFYEIKAIASLAGYSDNAEKCIKEIEDEFLKIASEHKNYSKKPTVYWEVWNSPYMSAGGGSFITSLVEKAGGVNIFSDVQQMYPVVSEESIILRNPDVIFLPSDSPVSSLDVENRAGWSEISAIQNHQIVKINADITTRAGPRIGYAVNLIASALYRTNGADSNEVLGQ